ncbi:hypothetical protein F4803DRAFT_522630 [Xylaria telfairii]|nr:hypothetical protein F4803DRAFT_522630 [Xylaria telfairii]
MVHLQFPCNISTTFSSGSSASLSNMAQQGGTYCPRASAAAPAPSDSPYQPQHQNGDDKDRKLADIEEGGEDTRAHGNLTHSGHIAKRPEASTKARTQTHGKNEDQDWEVVQPVEPDTEENVPDQEVSSHFDITLGWGRRKFTIFSWDVNIRKHAGGD